MISDEELAHKTWQSMCDVKYSSNTHDHIKPILEAFKQIREDERRRIAMKLRRRIAMKLRRRIAMKLHDDPVDCEMAYQHWSEDE